MRVIAGSARSVPLRAPAGDGTRPTTDKIKETLFNILSPELNSETRFLDLFAGSGAIGIEALSRGAKEAVFSDKSRKAVGVIRENLARTKLSPKAEVYCTDAVFAVKKLRERGRIFDMVFLDPPYGKGLIEQLLALDDFSRILAEDALVVLEESDRADLGFLKDIPFESVRCKVYKTNQHIFLRKKDAVKTADVD